MSRTQEEVVDRAIGWQVRLADASDEEWREFVAWLEASPEHAAAFDRIATDDLLVPVAAKDVSATPAYSTIFEPEPAQERPRRLGRWAAAGGGALVASAAALVFLVAKPAVDTSYVVATAPGEHRVLTLADGTRIEFNGGTRVTLDHATPRLALLDAGQAVFHVRHDATAPFEVRAGSASLRDLGTVFEVTRDADRLDVQVAEGTVLFRPDREAIALKPGMSLTSRGDSAPLALGRVPVENVGGWRSGRLSFSEAPLTEVAKAIERTSGVRLDIAPGLSERRFTGSFRLTGKADRDVPHVAALAGANYIRQEQRWTITL